MIIDILENAEQYYSLNPRFSTAFRFLKNPAVTTLSTERVDIDGDKLFALMSRKRGKKRSEARLEAHRKYIDIQCILSGTDTMGWRPLQACSEINTMYDDHKDIIFFDDDPLLWHAVHAGAFAVFFPGDAHAPMVSEGEIHKIVLKVAV